MAVLASAHLVVRVLESSVFTCTTLFVVRVCAGTIRRGELTTSPYNITHALKMQLFAHTYYYDKPPGEDRLAYSPTPGGINTVESGIMQAIFGRPHNAMDTHSTTGQTSCTAALTIICRLVRFIRQLKSPGAL